jgi:hypothetical protein
MFGQMTFQSNNVRSNEPEQRGENHFKKNCSNIVFSHTSTSTTWIYKFQFGALLLFFWQKIFLFVGHIDRKPIVILEKYIPTIFLSITNLNGKLLYKALLSLQITYLRHKIDTCLQDNNTNKEHIIYPHWTTEEKITRLTTIPVTKLLIRQ